MEQIIGDGRISCKFWPLSEIRFRLLGWVNFFLFLGDNKELPEQTYGEAFVYHDTSFRNPDSNDVLSLNFEVEEHLLHSGEAREDHYRKLQRGGNVRRRQPKTCRRVGHPHRRG